MYWVICEIVLKTHVLRFSVAPALSSTVNPYGSLRKEVAGVAAPQSERSERRASEASCKGLGRNANKIKF